MTLAQLIPLAINASLLLVVFWLALTAGRGSLAYLLERPNNRTVLALATGPRHPAVITLPCVIWRPRLADQLSAK